MRKVTRVWLSRILLVAVIARALIPAGYMLDAQAAGNGPFEFVICTAEGHHILALDANGSPADNKPSSHSDEPCAMAGTGVAALPAIVALSVTHTAAYATPTWPRRDVRLPPARAGPQLGSRAPPAFL